MPRDLRLASLNKDLILFEKKKNDKTEKMSKRATTKEKKEKKKEKAKGIT